MNGFSLTDEEKNTLLAVARESIESQLEKREEHETACQGHLQIPCGVFVTLKKNDALRGCIGRMVAMMSLCDTVRLMARSAAFQDHRFDAVGAAEWDSIDIEISVLTPLAPCADANTIEVGRHGVLIEKSGRSGVFLPQVAPEWGWDRTELLEQLCRKAGLPPESWKSSDAELYTFEAIVFSETDAGEAG